MFDPQPKTPSTPERSPAYAGRVPSQTPRGHSS